MVGLVQLSCFHDFFMSEIKDLLLCFCIIGRQHMYVYCPASNFQTFKLQINPPFLSPPVEIRYLRCLYVVGSYRSAQCFKKACKLLSTKPRASPQYLFIFLQVGVVCLSSIQFSLIFSQWVSHGVVWVEDFLTQIPH